MALIDYKGFRMTCQALLPLSDHSLCYGSEDAGKTVHKSNPELNETITQASQFLNVARHVVKVVRDVNPTTNEEEVKPIFLDTAVDIEVFIFIFFHVFFIFKKYK